MAEERNPAVDAAMEAKLQAEAAHYLALYRKETALAEVAELDLRAKVSKSALLAKAKRKDVWINAEDTVNRYGLADRIGYR